jgi:hypothetical protein
VTARYRPDSPRVQLGQSFTLCLLSRDRLMTRHALIRRIETSSMECGR